MIFLISHLLFYIELQSRRKAFVKNCMYKKQKVMHTNISITDVAVEITAVILVLCRNRKRLVAIFPKIVIIVIVFFLSRHHHYLVFVIDFIIIITLLFVKIIIMITTTATSTNNATTNNKKKKK